MKRQLTSILLFSALLVGGASTFVSCTDHESDSAYNTSISLADAIKQQENDLVKANEYLAKLKEYVKEDGNANTKLLDAIDAQIKANKELIQNYAKEAILGQAADLNAAIKQTAAYKDIFKDLYGENGDAGMKKTLEDLDELINGADGQSGLRKQVEDIYRWYEAERLNKYLQGNDTINLSHRLDTLGVHIDKAIDAAKSEIYAKGYLTSNDIADKVTLEDVKTWYEATGINTRLQGMSDSLKNVSNAISDILKKGVTGIEIQATESPVTGYENAAFLGAQANILSAYYGRPSVGDDEFGVKAGKLLTTGNAGFIYVNVNPANVDPSVITFKLVDSQGNEAKGFKLGDPVKTDKVLKYGISRAATANGFYAIPVICENPENDGFSLDKGALKAAAKNVLAKLKNPKATNLNLSGLATTLYQSVNNQLTAYGVQASWSQRNENGGVDTKVITSKLNMAAFAVKPLSYKFLKGNQKIENISLDRFLLPTMSDKLNGINAIDFDNFIDPSTNTEIEVATIIAVPGVTLEQVGNNVSVKNGDKVLQTLENATIKSHSEAEKDIKVDDENGSEIGSTTLTTHIYKVAFKDDSMKNLIAEINTSISGKLGPVKDAIANANSFAAKYDNFVPTVNNLIKRIENGIHNVNKLLQPAMMYIDQNGNWNFVSTDTHFGSRFTGLGATTMVATSYTAELLAPAYKKQIYVKESGAEILVNGKATKDPFSGDIHKVVFNATNPGKYTIVYRAIDYTGNVVNKNFYITVK